MNQYQCCGFFCNCGMPEACSNCGCGSCEHCGRRHGHGCGHGCGCGHGWDGDRFCECRRSSSCMAGIGGRDSLSVLSVTACPCTACGCRNEPEPVE